MADAVDAGIVVAAADNAQDDSEVLVSPVGEVAGVVAISPDVRQARAEQATFDLVDTSITPGPQAPSSTVSETSYGTGAALSASLC
ncbi:hypothetical protein [Streptomyces xinghaiensis]|uniref:hypothetical protein n=1 Tax=Streptomyces xinghaiensis TaxID=1038928 RepID=UPI000592FD79|nr:hypothetical protein [Streptomyces xinghaiensis]MZE76729.1 hypothetical protein [Streptomyces sp. SID5475]